jgi:hypothetical protein
LEFLKEPQLRLEAGWPLDLGQLVSLPAIAVGLFLLYRSRRTTGTLSRESPPDSGRPA